MTPRRLIYPSLPLLPAHLLQLVKQSVKFSQRAAEAAHEAKMAGPTRKRPRVDVRRILGPEDFEKIERLKEQYAQMKKSGRSGVLNGSAMSRRAGEDEGDDDEGNNNGFDPSDLEV